jgi:hypothetical protein
VLNATAQFEKPQVNAEAINVTVECDESQLFKATCSESNIVKDHGSNAGWQCSFNAPHNSSISVAFKDTFVVPKNNLGEKKSLDEICTSGKPSATYAVMEEQHVCDSKYTVVVVVCSAAEEAVGNYFVLWGQGNVTEGSGVSFKLTASSALSTSSGMHLCLR